MPIRILIRILIRKTDADPTGSGSSTWWGTNTVCWWMVGVWRWVRLSYGVASTYVLADTADKAGKAHKVLNSPNTLCFLYNFFVQPGRVLGLIIPILPGGPLFFTKSEMEFLDINLTKDLRVFCSMLFTVFLLADFLRKPVSSLVLTTGRGSPPPFLCV
jgi:hypothetical protein